MLRLQLRDEFLASQTPGTVIALRQSGIGAAERNAEYILSITYPTEDVLNALRALDQNRKNAPIVLMGEKGRGKSHIMAVMHHAIESPDKVEQWLRTWSTQLNLVSFQKFSLQRGFKAITEPLHYGEYNNLWEILFDRHPQGKFFKGRFVEMAKPYPPRSLLIEMFKAQPVALILDEFQKWFDGLYDESGANGIKKRGTASLFIQLLSEIASDCPDLLILVVSVLNNATDAFQEIHRNSPILIDFRGPSAKKDRKHLVLHRLFSNRSTIPDPDIRVLTNTYAEERFRLRFAHLPDVEKERIALEVVEAWPFAPELLELLEDQILMAETAQETRDLIRILLQVFKARGDAVPLITPADFYIDRDDNGIQSLIDSISTGEEQQNLRTVARRNLEAVLSSNLSVPHVQEILSALWMRTLAPGMLRGAQRSDLHLDITRDVVIDDNTFQGELAQIIGNSVNVHGEEKLHGRLYFALNENPRSKVRSTAKNDKLWDPGVTNPVVGQAMYPGKDIERIREMIKHILVPLENQTPVRVIVLGPHWRNDPWSDVKDTDRPERWDRPVLLIVPTLVSVGPNKVIPELGTWLASHVSKKRNTVRFLLLSNTSSDLYTDPTIVQAARCVYLTSEAWKDDSKYRALREEFDKPLRDNLKNRFDRFAILRQWDYQKPQRCIFEVERHGKSGEGIIAAIEQKIRNDLFDQDEFQAFIEIYASNSRMVSVVMDELAEPPAQPTSNAIPYLGEQLIFDEMLKVAAKGGKVAFNDGGRWVKRLPQHKDYDEALTHIKTIYRVGLPFRQVQLGQPGDTSSSQIITINKSSNELFPEIPGPIVPGKNSSSGRVGGNNVVREPEAHSLNETNSEQTYSQRPFAPIPISRTTTEPATGINLSGQFEKWGIPSSTELTTATIKFSGLTVHQLKEILTRLPTAFKASLEINYLEDK